MNTKIILLLLGFWLSLGTAWGQYPPPNGWKTFAQVKFEPKYYEDVDMYVLTPKFTADIKYYLNKEFVLKGYVLPLADDTPFVILSKFPYSQCFFCGGAGPESVAAIYFKDKSKPNKFKMDQVITVKGKLTLNDSNLDELNFILKDAQIVK